VPATLLALDDEVIEEFLLHLLTTAFAQVFGRRQH
jgi:hypothetical protein